MHRNIRLLIEYDGTGYHGWQRQANALSVQEIMEDSIEKIVCHQVKLIGAGRTDAGVHALGQTANFYTTSSIPSGRIADAVNSVLPEDIVVREAEEVQEEFHARYSAKGKSYKYIVNNAKYPSALQRNREYHYPYELDFETMECSLHTLLGEHDFKGFMASGSSVRNTVRTITKAEMARELDRVFFSFHGNGFLYNMVRIMVGTILEAGRGNISVDDVQAVLSQGDRAKAGKTVPPFGLYLEQVFY